jgi:hypothetical protein
MGRSFVVVGLGLLLASSACVGAVAVVTSDAGSDATTTDGSTPDSAVVKDGASDAKEASVCGAQTHCDGGCVDTQTDPRNCGGCGNACDVLDAGVPPEGGTITAACNAGKCGVTCGGILSLCNGACVDLATDPKNCGSCGTTCDAGACSNKVCQSQVTVKIGQTVDLGATSSHSANFLLGTTITVTKPSTIQSFGVLSKSSGPKVVIALYTDSAGNPGTLVAQTGINTLTNSTQEFPSQTKPTIPAGTYWLVGEYDTNAAIGYSNSVSTTVKYVSHTFGSALPATFGAPLSYTGQQFNYWIVVLQ